MAETLAARQLTDAYRQAQARLGAQTVALMFRIWPLLDPSDLDATFERWLTAVSPIVNRQRDLSSRLAANYYTTFRTLEVGPSAPAIVPVLAGAVDPDQLATSMLVTGPVSIRSALARGVPFDRAVDTAKANTARAASRHAENGGRDTITNTTKSDRLSLGWARSTSGKPCAFCALMASRGPVYKSKSSADFEPHDGCHCTPEPVYKELSPQMWPGRAAEYRRIYSEVAKGLPPKDAINAFRRALPEPSGAATATGSTN